MPDVKTPIADRILGKGLITAETIRQELVDRLVRELSANRYDQRTSIEIARNISWEFEPMLAATLSDTEIGSWIAGAAHVANRLPARLFDQFQPPYGQPDEWWKRPLEEYDFWLRNRISPPQKPPTSIIATAGGDEPTVRFPAIEKAAESLFKRNVVTRDVYDTLTQGLRNRAFTVARVNSNDALTTIRDALYQDVRDGASLSGFKALLRGKLDGSKLGPAHLETVFRTNVQTAYSDGHQEIADNPIVAAVFPYMEYLPIRDARCRPEHLALGKLGLNGTGIYRADDPIWDLFLPPWSYNCRCGTNLLTIEAAARRGVKEAQRWLRTSVPPENPEYCIDRINFRPELGWGGRSRRLVRMNITDREGHEHSADDGKFVSKGGGGGKPAGGKPSDGYVRDNPGGEWLANEQARAKSSKSRGSITASSKTTRVDVAKLLKLKGQNGEHNNMESDLSKDKVAKLQKSIEENGYDESNGPLVWVDVNGRATIAEGNHRIRVAANAIYRITEDRESTNAIMRHLGATTLRTERRTEPELTLAMSLDADGHEHKGKGPGGGQFTSKGAGGSAPAAESSMPRDAVTDAADAKQKRTATYNAKLNQAVKVTGRDIWDVIEELGGHEEHDAQVEAMDRMIAEHGDKPKAWEPTNPFDITTFQKFDSESTEQAQKRREWWLANHHLRKKFRDALVESDVFRTKKTEHLHTVQKVLEWMPLKAIRAMHGKVEGAKFYKGLGDLTKAVGEGPVRGMVGGCWDASTETGKGTLHLDGGFGDYGMEARGIYAHEFGHACDWVEGNQQETETEHGTSTTGSPGHQISDTRDWIGAFNSELALGQLSEYGATSRSEGFAEFARLLWGSGQRRKDIRAEYPLCYEVFKKHGLV